MIYTDYLRALKRLSPASFTGNDNVFLNNMLKDSYIRNALTQEFVANKIMSESIGKIILEKNIMKYL